MTRLLPLLGLAALGCFNQLELAVSVLTPDGGNPFAGPQAATQVRAEVEGSGIRATSAVAPNGAFSVSLDLASFNRPARLVLEALAEGAVVGTGATPPVVWSALGSSLVPVFVQRRDALVLAPPALTLGVTRVAPRIVPLTSPLVAVIGGFEQESSIDVLDLFYLGRSTNPSVLRAPFTGDVTPVVLRDNRVLVLKGCNATLWNLSTNAFAEAGALAPPAERCGTSPITDSGFVPDRDGGAYFVGGQRRGSALTRVDRILPDGRWVVGVELAVPRVNPAVIVLGNGELLVAGGQPEATAPALERYTLEGRLPMDRRALRTGDADLDARTGATLVATERGAMAYLLGGARAGGTELAANDAVLDLGCLDQACPLLLRTLPLLRTRRRDAVAAVAEGDQVLVAGGSSPAGAIESFERVDGTNPREPVARGVIAETGAAGASLARVHTGAVLVAGAGQPRVMLYRH